MKTALLLLACALSVGPLACGGAAGEAPTDSDDVTAQTRIRVPILDAKTKKPLAQHNAALRAKGAETFPEFLDMTVAKLDGFNHLFDVVDAANKALGTKLELQRQSAPTELPGLCYLGNVRNVPKLMRDLNDSVFDEFIAIYMWKFRSESHRGDAFGSTGPEDVSKFPRAFQDFHGHGDDLMVVFSANDDFADRLPATIPRCGSPTKQ